MGRMRAKQNYGPITKMLEDAPLEVHRVYTNRPVVTAILLSSMMTWFKNNPSNIDAPGTAYCRYVLEEQCAAFKREKLYADGLVYKLFEHVRFHARTNFIHWLTTTHSNNHEQLAKQLESISNKDSRHPLQSDLF